MIAIQGMYPFFLLVKHRTWWRISSFFNGAKGERKFSHNASQEENNSPERQERRVVQKMADVWKTEQQKLS